MDDLDVLARDFGYRPQGKSAPMRSDASDRYSSPSTVRSATPSSSPFMDDRDGLLFNDVFGGPPKFTNTSGSAAASSNDFDYDSIFKTSASSNLRSNNDNSFGNSNSSKTTSLPVYDKPVYDDDIFEGLPGVKSKSVSSSSNLRFDENIFASMTSPPGEEKRSDNGDQFDDLLGNLGRNEGRAAREVKDVRSSRVSGLDDLLGNMGRNEKVPEAKSGGRSSSLRGGGDFDDLLGGFSSINRSTPGPTKSNHVMDNPFVVLESTSTPASSSSGIFTDPLEEISKLGKSEDKKPDASTVGGGVFDELDPLGGLGKSTPPFSPEKVDREKVKSPSRSGPTISGTQSSTGREHAEKSSFRYTDNHSQKVSADNFQESPSFDVPSVSTDSKTSFYENASSPPYASGISNEKNFQADVSPRSEEPAQSVDDIWLTVSEIPLLTQPTKAPPPSRPPPPIPRQTSKAETGFFSSHTRKKGDDFSPSYSLYTESPKPGRAEGKSPPVASQLDDLEDFVMGRTQNSVDEHANVHSSEEMDAAAAAMKEAMDRAEAKFRHAKEVREREYAKAARSKEMLHMEDDEQAMQDAREREFRENQETLERERWQREKEEEEREQRRLERERARQAEIERERARQAESERERARQAVERATREARERAAAEARERAAAETRRRSERAAVEKAQAEARQRAERMAVQRAQAEARERAAAEARERANAEAREREVKEKAEARRRAERAAVEKAAAEARERAAAEARERAAAAAAAAARMNQQKNENDLESFFSTRASSAPKARANSFDPFFDSQFQSKGGSDAASRTSSTSGPPSNIRKASSTTNIVDDLSSIFGGPPSSGEFQEVEGESEERRRARLERHQRTQERAAKALAEKNQRDLQAQREQEERHRIAESLDIEIKRWAAGKEGNLRALLSTLQYVLWPECGWQPVSLTDLITGASVKKVYRKATLCIHPDKVQQKGATLQQKYIAEKVFDLLKEAWNKFNSEELF